jgi:RHS repeat-associated protein
LAGAGRFWSDWTAVTGQQYGYVFDNIGNRISAQSGSLGNMSTVRYTANDLNEYTGVVTPGFKDILGLAIARLHASRLATVSDGNGDSAAYSYLANSPLAGQITFSRNGATRMTTTKQYDYLNRLGSIASSPSNSFTYQYNLANQRTLDRVWDGSYWRYGYDALGQVVSGNKYWSDMTPVAGQQFGYDFDTIGNRTETEAGGDPTGANLRVAHYTNNTVNEITSRDVPGYVDVMGDTLATNTVSVNGQAAYQKVEYFREQSPVANSAAAVWDGVTVSAPGQNSVTGHVYVAQTPENYSYDNDGNLLSDGRWSYTWDAENRLINMTSLNGAPSGSQLQLAFVYDYQGRRIQKVVSTWNNNNYVAQYTDNYAYDGWNCIGILNPALGLLNSFLWGSDLSGSMQGAGGVGGLIEESYYGTATTNCFAAFDGNGNVSALVNAADGTTVANYEYGPFGEVIRATGPMAKPNPFRFSTKYQDDETDLLYYGYRYYNPSMGRWLSRDPIEEEGFILIAQDDMLSSYGENTSQNLYEAMSNDAVDSIDSFGLICVKGKITLINYKWIKGNIIKRAAVAAVINSKFPVIINYGTCSGCCIPLYNINTDLPPIPYVPLSNVLILLFLHLELHVSECL